MNLENLILVYILGVISFVIGYYKKKYTIIMLFLLIEIIMLSVNLIFTMSSIYLNDIIGQLLSLYLLTIIGAEVGIGLALLVNYYRIRGVITIEFISSVKG
jgi:NADH:ubiquinone oxidoreductase subunit K